MTHNACNTKIEGQINPLYQQEWYIDVERTTVSSACTLLFPLLAIIFNSKSRDLSWPTNSNTVLLLSLHFHNTVWLFSLSQPCLTVFTFTTLFYCLAFTFTTLFDCFHFHTTLFDCFHFHTTLFDCFHFHTTLFDCFHFHNPLWLFSLSHNTVLLISLSQHCFTDFSVLWILFSQSWSDWDRLGAE